MLLSMRALDDEFARSASCRCLFWVVLSVVCSNVFLCIEIELRGNHGLFASVAFAESAFVCTWPRCWCISVAGVIADAAWP